MTDTPVAHRPSPAPVDTVSTGAGTGAGADAASGGAASDVAASDGAASDVAASDGAARVDRVSGNQAAVDRTPDGAASTTAARTRVARRPVLVWTAVAVVLAGLATASVFVGVADLSLVDLLRGGVDAHETMLLLVSRLPRTIAVILSGMALGVAGMIMQMLSRNRFVEPTTVGTAESAALGLLVVTLLWPAASLMVKMSVASVFALAGAAMFFLLLRSIKSRSSLVVPLVGLMLGSVIGAVTTFFAYRYDLLQTLASWMIGDLSGVLRGRYELLWIVAGLTVLAYLAADRFTAAGMGSEVATTLGMNYHRIMLIGLAIVAVVTAIVVVTVGTVPFLGLVVPNLAALVVGDNLRRALPWVAVMGAGLMLVCDLIGRLVRFPYEVPIGVVVGVVGAALFLVLLVRSDTGAE